MQSSLSSGFVVGFAAGGEDVREAELVIDEHALVLLQLRPMPPTSPAAIAEMAPPRADFGFAISSSAYRLAGKRPKLDFSRAGVRAGWRRGFTTDVCTRGVWRPVLTAESERQRG